MGLQKRLTLYGVAGLIALSGFLAYFAISTVKQVNDLIYEERLDRAQEIAQDVGEVFGHVRREAEKNALSIGQGWQTSVPPLPQALSSLQGHLRQQLAAVHLLEPPLFVGVASTDGKVLRAEPYWGDRIDVTVPDIEESTGTYVAKAIISQGEVGLSLMLPIIDSRQQRQGYLIVEIAPLPGTFDTFLQSHGHRYQLQIILPDSGMLISSSVPLGQDEISPDWEVVRPLASTYRSGLIEHPANGNSKPHMAIYAPVPGVPLGIILEDVAGKALALPSTMSQRFLWSTGIALALMALLAWLVSRRLVRPIEHLAQDAQRIAAGDLETPIPGLGKDETGKLARNFETMRRQLKASLDDLKGWNVKLDQQVRERTQEIEKLYNEVAHREEQCHLLLDKIITAQEDERKRLARELHDETGQFLTGLALSLKGLEERIAGEPEMVKERLESLQNLTTKATEDVRRLIWDLRPSLLDDMGLVEAIAWYMDNYLKPKGVKCHLETRGFSRRLPLAVESSLFRLLQEAINNIAKHAQAKEVWLKLERTGEIITGSISDDGIGFAPTRLPAGANTGLLGMEERMTLLGGKLEIESTPGEGTRIEFQVPLQDGQHG